MKRYKIWILRLVLPVRFGTWLTGAILLLMLLPLFYLGNTGATGAGTPALFFSVTIAYIIPVFSFITAKARDALHELQPWLDLDEPGFQQCLDRLDSASVRESLAQVLGGAAFGFAHISFISGSASFMVTDALSSVIAALSTLGTVLVWIVMTTVISMLIKQAVMFARIGRHHVRVYLLNTRRLVPFARVATYSSLAIIGSLALLPLMSIDGDMNLARALPGAVAMSVPLVVLFIVPVWPLHRRVAEMKEAELRNLDDRIEQYEAQVDQGLEQLVPLLHYRREIALVPTWPFDAGAVTRLSLYLVIPPLTWAGAALIEKLVDSFI
jgi:hypothetical protein